jgi:hypothetical protein
VKLTGTFGIAVLLLLFTSAVTVISLPAVPADLSSVALNVSEMAPTLELEFALPDTAPGDPPPPPHAAKKAIAKPAMAPNFHLF